MNEKTRDKDILNLWFNNIGGVGNASLHKLKNVLGSLENVYDASKNIISKIIGEEKAGYVADSRDLGYVRELREMLMEKKIDIVYPGHEAYPSKLLNIYDYPFILYVRGKLRDSLNIYNKNIGIVGARMADVYGKEIARMFGRELASEGINIISGLAMGIDGMSHRGALDAGGYTVGVLGCGIDVIYPKENYDLYMEMISKGAVISEYGPGVEPNAGQFPVRNRIISGLSDGLLVVEARKKSGSLITADLALEYGKQIYSVPGKITDKNSEGTNNLIKAGALCVTFPKDIIDDLRGINTIEGEKSDTDDGTLNKNSLAPAEKMLYSCLSLEPVYIDDIIDRMNMGVSDTINLLYNMEEKGLIKQPVKGYYIISI